MTYHVLSNFDIGKILTYGGFSLAILWAVFGYFANRDASPNQPPKSLWRRLLPWVVFCIFLSNVCLFVYRCIDYPWNIDPQPSQASVYREISYMGSGYPLWGWANDYQLPLLSSFTKVLLWFCWTIYAFNFKRSDTSWWKKTCKVIAYIIISIIIWGFQLHQFGDLWGYAMLLAVVVILLWISHVRPKKKEASTSDDAVIESSQHRLEEVEEKYELRQNESPSRFMPKAAFGEEVIESTPIQESKPIEKVEETHETVSKLSESMPKEVVMPETAHVNEHLSQSQAIYKTEPDMMYCKYCGKKIEADSKFCKYCGRRL